MTFLRHFCVTSVSCCHDSCAAVDKISIYISDYGFNLNRNMLYIHTISGVLVLQVRLGY